MSYNELRQRGTPDFPIELYHMTNTHPRYEMTAHWHTDIEIIRVIRGKLNLRINTSQYVAEKGDIIFVNPERVHSAIPHNCVYECIVFNPEAFVTESEEIKRFTEGMINGEYQIEEFFCTDNEIHRTANLLFDKLSEEYEGKRFIITGTLYNLFGLIMEKNLYSVADTSVSGKNVPKIKKVLTFIRKNYRSDITLSDMAEYSGMSKKYFCSFFKKMTTKTPFEYLNSYRIEKATKMLLNTDKSVTDIAYECGFNDLSYFIKTFRKIKGVTPNGMRKEIQ